MEAYDMHNYQMSSCIYNLGYHSMKAKDEEMLPSSPPLKHDIAV